MVSMFAPYAPLKSFASPPTYSTHACTPTPWNTTYPRTSVRILAATYNPTMTQTTRFGMYVPMYPTLQVYFLSERSGRKAANYARRLVYPAKHYTPLE